jgi:hypothetical protein
MAMKKNIYTMLLLAPLLVVSLVVSLAHAQHETPVTHEPVYRKSGVNNFTLVTTNDTVFKLLITKFEPIIVRYSVEYKTDRLGRHKEAFIYFRSEDQGAILDYVKSFNAAHLTHLSAVSKTDF